MTTFEDVQSWACELPETTLGPSYGGFPAIRVNRRLVTRVRGEMADEVEERSGAPYGVVLVVGVDDLGEKEALLSSGDDAFVTVPHYDGHPSVLVRLDRLDDDGHKQLFELLTEAWLRAAPRRAVRAYVERFGPLPGS